MIDMTPRERFLLCANGVDGDVADGALWLSCDDYPNLEIERYQDVLNTCGAALREETLGDTDSDGEPARIIASIHRVLQRFLPLRGSGGADPKSHYIHSVIDRRQGVPLACSVIWIGVARRAGIVLDGISVPGHFLVKLGDDVFDPFLGGEDVDQVAVLDRLVDKYGVHRDIVASHIFQPASVRDMLARMTRNLRGCYAVRQQWKLALRSADRCVALLPEEPRERRDRGIVRWQAGQLQEAVEDLEFYCEHARGAQDIPKVASIAQHLRQQSGQ